VDAGSPEVRPRAKLFLLAAVSSLCSTRSDEDMDSRAAPVRARRRLSTDGLPTDRSLTVQVYNTFPERRPLCLTLKHSSFSLSTGRRIDHSPFVAGQRSRFCLRSILQRTSVVFCLWETPEEQASRGLKTGGFDDVLPRMPSRPLSLPLWVHEWSLSGPHFEPPLRDCFASEAMNPAIKSSPFRAPIPGDPFFPLVEFSGVSLAARALGPLHCRVVEQDTLSCTRC